MEIYNIVDYEGLRKRKVVGDFNRGVIPYEEGLGKSLVVSRNLNGDKCVADIFERDFAHPFEMEDEMLRDCGIDLGVLDDVGYMGNGANDDLRLARNSKGIEITVAGMEGDKVVFDLKMESGEKYIFRSKVA